MVLKEIALEYKKIYKGDIVQILLYGSYARGDFEQDSDIDVVAIVKGERKMLQDKLKQVWDISADLELEYGVIISPTVIPYEEFLCYRDILPYYRNIMREGVQISA